MLLCYLIIIALLFSQFNKTIHKLWYPAWFLCAQVCFAGQDTFVFLQEEAARAQRCGLQIFQDATHVAVTQKTIVAMQCSQTISHQSVTEHLNILTVREMRAALHTSKCPEDHVVVSLHSY